MLQPCDNYPLALIGFRFGFSGIDRSYVQRSDLSGFGVEGGFEFAARHVDESKPSQDAGESLAIPRILVLRLLAKMVVDVIELSFAPVGMDRLREGPIRIG